MLLIILAKSDDLWLISVAGKRNKKKKKFPFKTKRTEVTLEVATQFASKIIKGKLGYFALKLWAKAHFV